MIKLLLSLTAISLGLFLYNHSQNQQHYINKADFLKFKEFQQQNQKSYASENEQLYRFKIFLDNKNMIENHNADTEMTYTLEINQFADQTWEELSSKYLNKDLEQSPIIDHKCESAEEIEDDDDVRKFDWQDKNMVTAVKNQQQCGSCWAFGTIGSIESAYALKTGKLQRLSEQQLVDCGKAYNLHGCGGGLINRALYYAIDIPIVTEDSYPYKGENQKCQLPEKFDGIKIKKCIKAIPNNNGLVKHIKQQPIAVALSADLTLFFYRFGVYNPKHCGKQVNHAVLAVGFNLDYSVPYFRIKNSWGKWWGQWGYFKIALSDDPHGKCNIAGSGKNFYPVLE